MAPNPVWWKGGHVATATVVWDQAALKQMTEQAAKTILTAAAAKVTAEAKIDLHDKIVWPELSTGALEASIHAINPGESNELTAGPYTAYVVAPLKYAIPQEEGWTDARTHKLHYGKHYLRIALEGLGWSTTRSEYGTQTEWQP